MPVRAWNKARGLTAAFCAALLLAGCTGGGAEAGSDPAGVPASVTDQSKTDMETSRKAQSPPSGPANASDTLVIEPFDAQPLPEAVAYEGEIVDGAVWRDRNGRNWLVITEKSSGEFFSEGFVSNLYAYCYSDATGRVAESWSVKEFNKEIWQTVTYMEPTLKVSDLDGDGYAETLFMYEVGTDGGDPSGLKLMLHVKGKKYAVRGQFAGLPEDAGKVEEQHFDPAFDGLDARFREYASGEWDALLDRIYAGF